MIDAFITLGVPTALGAIVGALVYHFVTRR